MPSLRNARLQQSYLSALPGRCLNLVTQAMFCDALGEHVSGAEGRQSQGSSNIARHMRLRQKLLVLPDHGNQAPGPAGHRQGGSPPHEQHPCEANLRWTGGGERAGMHVWRAAGRADWGSPPALGSPGAPTAPSGGTPKKGAPSDGPRGLMGELDSG